MKDFRLFDLMDFVMDEDFIRWVHEKKADDENYWNNWLHQNPEKHLIIAEARRILESVKTEEKIISDQEIDSQVQRLLQTIRGNAQETETPARQTLTYAKWWYAAAALIMVVAGSWYFLQNKPVQQNKFAYRVIIPSKSLIEQTNTSDKPVTIKLDDGSTIELAANSRVSYSKTFDSADTRDVYLSGEAFFTVTKNPLRPFRVFANEIVTKVLGTSFTVRSFEIDSTIRVTVRTGKVSVFAQASVNNRETISPGKLGGIIVTPNQQLVYEKTGQKFQRVLLENPEMVIQHELSDPKTVYEEAPLEKVFVQLAKEYGINIVYDPELLKDCTVTADLTNESFYHKLDLISKAVGARYEVIDGQVVIQSNGCQ